MTAKILFILLISLLPLVISLLLVRKGRLSAVRQYLSRSEKRQNFAASLLAIVILVFHLAYSLVFPVTVGLAVSSLYAFFAIAVKRNTLLLLFIRSSTQMFLAIFSITVPVGFVPGMFPIAYTLAVVLITVSCFPDIPQDNPTEPNIPVQTVTQ